MIFNRRLCTALIFILALSILLTACSSANLPAASPVPVKTSTSAALPTERPTESPVTAEPQTYTNPEYGFSLEYPEGYELVQNFSHSIAILAPRGTPGHRERGFLTVEMAGDETPEWYANQVKEDNAYIGIPITSSVMGIGGQKAVILGGLPGQDLNRQVFIVYKGLLYHLTFMPDTPQAGEEYQQMETLYTAVTNSLRFLPERTEVPPVLSMINMAYLLEKALKTRSADDITRLVGDEFFVAYWTPQGETFDRYGRNEAAPLVTSKLLSPAPDLAIQRLVDWESLIGTQFPFTGYFPNENIQQPMLAHGWGPQGSDEAAIIIAMRGDGSLYWRGVFIAKGKFAK